MHEAHGTIQFGGLEHEKIKTGKRRGPLRSKRQSSTQKPTPLKNQNNKPNSNPKNPEYAYHKGTSFAKEKEEGEILCPQVVSQGPVFKQKEQSASKTFAHNEYSS